MPLLAIIFYSYSAEIKKARRRNNWNAIFSGVTCFGMEFLLQTVNGWVFALTDHAALWSTPGSTALRTMVGWNIELMFVFLLFGIIYHNIISHKQEKKVLNIPNWWFWACVSAAVCVIVECLLNLVGLLHWTYPWWNLSLTGVCLIFLARYLLLFAVVILVLKLPTMHLKFLVVGGIYGVAISANVIGLAVLGWHY